jgi:hypothetical protein
MIGILGFRPSCPQQEEKGRFGVQAVFFKKTIEKRRIIHESVLVGFGGETHCNSFLESSIN